MPQTQIALINELVDPHDDTSRLAAAMGELAPAGRSHVDYFRALQRNGRKTFAQPAMEVNQ